MSGLKKIFFWVFLGLAIGGGIYAYFHLKNNKKPSLDALSVLPDSCVIYFNTSGFSELNKKINSQSLIADKLKLFSEIKNLCNTVEVFDSLFNSNEDLREELANTRIHFAFYEKNKSWLASFNIKQLGEEENIAESLKTLLKAAQNEKGIFQFRLGSATYYFKLNEGVVCFSGSDVQCLEALGGSGARLENNKAFVSFKNTLTESSQLAVFIDHHLYSRSKTAEKLNLSAICKKGYSAGAIDFQPSQIKINGYLLPDSSELISLFKDQAPQSTEDIAENFPSNTLSFKAYGFSDFALIKTKLEDSEDLKSYWDAANNKALYNIELDFNENIGNQLLSFETSSPKAEIVGVEVSETFKAREHLSSMSDSLLSTDSILVYQLNSQPEKRTLQLFLPFSNVLTNYAIVYHGHIFFSETKEKLTQLLRDLQNGRQLINNESFAAYASQQFSDEFNYLLYCSPNQLKSEIPAYFNFEAISKEDAFDNFKHLSFSLSNNKFNFKYRLQLQNESEAKTKEQNILWTLNLDTTSHMRACGFVNHVTGENELLVQDDNKTLYLINAKGTILWKKQLDEKIVSPIYTVDIYKKNKYQLLFNTKNHLHLIDRNGNYVEEYPVKLPSEATSEMTLFDYDNDKDYRIFIACKNNSIYNYSIHGKKQEKFATVKTENEVVLPVQYVKVGASDYLVALDKEGKIYTFSRKGVGRIGLRNRAIANCQAFYVDANNSVNSTYIVYVDDKSALINKISFADKKEIIKLNSEVENAAVNFCLVDDNRSMDLVLTKNSSVMAYSFSGNLIAEKNSFLNLGRSDFFSDESHSVFYSLSEEQKDLVVSDQIKGTTRVFPATALPLTSNLFKDNKKYLIITNGKQLNCVALN